MLRSFIVAILSLTLTACFSPTVVTLRSAQGFSLPDLRKQDVAFWPIPTARIDPATTQPINQEYGSSGQFLDALGDRFSSQLAKESQSSVVSSRQVVIALSRSEETRPFLDSNRLLGTDSDNRFANTTPVNLAPLAGLPELRSVRYLVLPRDAEATRNIKGSSPTYVPGSFGQPGTWVGGGETTKTKIKLRVVVMDWPTHTIVWDGWFVEDAYIFFSPAESLHRTEKALVEAFLEATGVVPMPSSMPVFSGQPRAP